MMRLPATLDEGVITTLGRAKYPTGFGVGHVYDGSTLAALEISPDLPLGADGLPEGYADGVAAALPLLKADLKAQIDARAEALRLTLITPGSGQAMEYQEAYAEAVQVDAASKANPAATFDPVAYPMLAASLGYDLDPTTGKPTVDIPGEARAVLAAYDAYQKAGAAIRAARLAAKATVEASTDTRSAQAAFGAIRWPSLT
ncbi:hypothetical protein [Methylobacterium sp. J-070]|uniref:hypothetical protein n=1 Tax=Methylobacterium sp. J-070 TaxID=2836650 RepID=UPI001FBA7D0E|nr:hypothetical protein [Methylobacterium sp. J-070]MCJ2053982.1 hypothetical protein [Methylobacterium sp. J-070]